MAGSGGVWVAVGLGFGMAFCRVTLVLTLSNSRRLVGWHGGITRDLGPASVLADGKFVLVP